MNEKRKCLVCGGMVCNTFKKYCSNKCRWRKQREKQKQRNGYKEYIKNYNQVNKKRLAIQKSLRRRRIREQIGDEYVVEKLCRGSIINKRDIPYELIEIKRLQIQLIRLKKDRYGSKNA